MTNEQASEIVVQYALYLSYWIRIAASSNAHAASRSLAEANHPAGGMGEPAAPADPASLRRGETESVKTLVQVVVVSIVTLIDNTCDSTFKQPVGLSAGVNCTEANEMISK